jgi:hypothetical protein
VSRKSPRSLHERVERHERPPGDHPGDRLGGDAWAVTAWVVTALVTGWAVLVAEVKAAPLLIWPSSFRETRPISVIR